MTCKVTSGGSGTIASAAPIAVEVTCENNQLSVSALDTNGRVHLTYDFRTWFSKPAVPVVGGLQKLVNGNLTRQLPPFNDDFIDIAGLTQAGFGAQGQVYYNAAPGNFGPWVAAPAVSGGLVDLIAANIDATPGDELIGLSRFGTLWTWRPGQTAWTQIPGPTGGLASIVAGDFDGDNVAELAGLSVAGFGATGQVWIRVGGTWSQLTPAGGLGLATLTTIGRDSTSNLEGLVGVNKLGQVFYNRTVVPGVIANWLPANVGTTRLFAEVTTADLTGTGTDQLYSLTMAGPAAQGQVFTTTGPNAWAPLNTLATGLTELGSTKVWSVFVPGITPVDALMGVDYTGDIWYTTTVGGTWTRSWDTPNDGLPIVHVYGIRH
jgi:hypothetical protein